MKQTQKLDELIRRIIKEELENNLKEDEKEFVTSDGTARTATSQQRQSIAKAKAGDTIKYRKAGTATTSTTAGTMQEEESEEVNEVNENDLGFQLAEWFITEFPKLAERILPKYSDQDSLDYIQKLGNSLILLLGTVGFFAGTGAYATYKGAKDKIEAAKNKISNLVKSNPVDKIKSMLKMKESEEMKVADTEVLESTPTATEIAGKMSEILDSLTRLSEAGKDDKHKKYAAKVMKAMEAAKSALEGLTAHEVMLEEKEKAVKEKDAQGHLKAIEKHLGKIVKDKDAVSKMMKKMPIEKVIAMKDKMADKPMDEEKLARVMLKHSLKEAAVKKN